MLRNTHSQHETGLIAFDCYDPTIDAEHSRQHHLARIEELKKTAVPFSDETETSLFYWLIRQPDMRRELRDVLRKH
ncbi:hypothetical protein AAE121_004912 [Salmonella enterica]